MENSMENNQYLDGFQGRSLRQYQNSAKEGFYALAAILFMATLGGLYFLLDVFRLVG